MTFFSILCALLIEQLKPLRADNQIYAEIKRFAMRIEAWFNAGHASNGRLGWFLMIGGLMLPTALIYGVLLHYGWVTMALGLVIAMTLVRGRQGRILTLAGGLVGVKQGSQLGIAHPMSGLGMAAQISQ